MFTNNSNNNVNFKSVYMHLQQIYELLTDPNTKIKINSINITTLHNSLILMYTTMSKYNENNEIINKNRLNAILQFMNNFTIQQALNYKNVESILLFAEDIKHAMNNNLRYNMYNTIVPSTWPTDNSERWDICLC